MKKKNTISEMREIDEQIMEAKEKEEGEEDRPDSKAQPETK